MSVHSINLTPLVYLYGVLAIAFVIGYPAAAWLLNGQLARDKGPNTPTVVYLAPLVGLPVLLLAVFYASQLTSLGTDAVALHVAAVLVLLGLAGSALVVPRNLGRRLIVRSVARHVP